MPPPGRNPVSPLNGDLVVSRVANPDPVFFGYLDPDQVISRSIRLTDQDQVKMGPVSATLVVSASVQDWSNL